MKVAQPRAETVRRFLPVIARSCVLLLGLVGPWRQPHAWAAELKAPAQYGDLFGSGRQSIGIAGGHGLSLRIGRGQNEEIDDLQFLYLAPRWSIGISDPMGGQSLFRGNFELVLEGAFHYIFEPKDGFAGGFTPLIRYNFLTGGRWIPFVQAGAGLLALDADLKAQADGLNFSPQAGVGVHYFISDRVSLTGEWRFHHISNADLRERNIGINSSLVMFGITYFLR
jgi:lipid A 3-O-deacylase